MYTHFCTEYAKRSKFFIIFVTNEIFKSLFTKRKLIAYYYFINIYIVYCNRFFMLMKYHFFNFSIINRDHIVNFFFFFFFAKTLITFTSFFLYFFFIILIILNIFFITEEAKETILDFSQRTVTLL